MSFIEDLATALAQAKRGVVLTGAGVSTDSGIPDFRSRMGLWGGADPLRYATLAGLLSDPAGFYGFWRNVFGRLPEIQPSFAHRFVAALEARGHVRAVITQNVDGLHQAAGSRRVHEVHGSFRRLLCMSCPFSGPLDFGEGALPRCPSCGGLLRPSVVFFGEALGPAFDEATADLLQADFLLVLGTSLEVHPVAGLVPLAAEHHIPIAIINRDPTPYDHLASFVAHAELRPTLFALAKHLDLGELGELQALAKR
ncbi:MAG: Sir2 family NAD-dependent protein deacetylase [Sandaracinaceae bacterium]|nr:Sir2 family NAD-dependent protein deacetylase [Sandaracinaceae bacterium]MDW8247595.1 Sir2 family NAD-dependent protein deacetylase [Sandaracinaceae bacterium]